MRPLRQHIATAVLTAVAVLAGTPVVADADEPTRPAQPAVVRTVPEVHTTRARVWTSVPITIGYAPRAYRVAARLAFTDLRPGDVVDLSGVVQLTTPYTYNVMACRYILVSSTAGPGPTGGTYVARPMGGNFNRDVHHHTLPVTGSYVVPGDFGGGPLYFSLVVYSASTAAKPGHKLALDWVEWTAKIYRAS